MARASRPVAVVDPPPTLRLFGPKRQKLRRTLTLRASCDEPCKATVRAKLVLISPSASSSAQRKLAVRPTTRNVGAGKRATLKLALPKATFTAARTGLAIKGAKARLQIVATATDSRGQRSAKATRTIRLTLPR